MPTTRYALSLILTALFTLCSTELRAQQTQDSANAPATPSQEADASAPGFPDTVAGRRASAFVAGFNANDSGALRGFETAHRAKSALAARSIEDRVAQGQKLYADWGKLKVVEVISSGERDITVVADATGSEMRLDMEFELEPEPPYGLIAIRISGGPIPTSLTTTSTLDAARVRQTVKSVAAALKHRYVYPEKGDAMALALKTSLAKGEFDGIQSASTLARQLTRQLRDICHDRHLAVRAGSNTPNQDAGDDWWASDRCNNYGFVAIERLPGNVGYIRFDEFNPSDEAKHVAGSAMNFLSGTDALIFDLRENGGGSPEMIAFLSGYLFDESIHLNSFYNRPSDSYSQTWSDASVPGVRYGQTKPVYVLTSDHTFSAAEEFTYNLKHLKRATIVGETTGGGAHPIEREVLNDQLWMTVPFGRAVNPVTKTNWEGVGVKPNVESAAAEALSTAHRLGLVRLLEQSTSEVAKKDLRRALRQLEYDAPRALAP